MSVNTSNNSVYKRCKNKVANGLKCIVCDNYFHNSCAKLANNIVFIDESSVKCCDNVDNINDKRVDKKDGNSYDDDFFNAIEGMKDQDGKIDVSIFKYVIKQKDDIIEGLRERVKLLSQHIDLLTKDNNEGRTNESVKLCEEDCTVNNTLPTISNTKVMNEKSTGKLSSGKVGNANASNAHYPQVNQGNKQKTDEVNRNTMLNENKQKLWTDVVRKPKRVTVIGKNVEAKTIDILQGVPKTVTMHVYRLSPETKVDQLLDFLKPQYPEVTCECLQ